MPSAACQNLTERQLRRASRPAHLISRNLKPAIHNRETPSKRLIRKLMMVNWS
jgi:hypothetical protein